MDISVICTVVVALIGALTTTAYKAPRLYDIISTTLSIAVSFSVFSYCVYGFGYGEGLNDAKIAADQERLSSIYNPYINKWTIILVTLPVIVQQGCRLISYIVTKIKEEEGS